MNRLQLCSRCRQDIQRCGFPSFRRANLQTAQLPETRLLKACHGNATPRMGRCMWSLPKDRAALRCLCRTHKFPPASVAHAHRTAGGGSNPIHFTKRSTTTHFGKPGEPAGDSVKVAFPGLSTVKSAQASCEIYSRVESSIGGFDSLQIRVYFQAQEAKEFCSALERKFWLNRDHREPGGRE
jgi:hypothetical protein